MVALAVLKVLHPPLRFLHPDESLSEVKLAQMERMTNEHLKQTLVPGQKDCERVASK